MLFLPKKNHFNFWYESLFFQILEILWSKNSFTKNFNKPQNILICFFFVIFFFYRKKQKLFIRLRWEASNCVSWHKTRQTDGRISLDMETKWALVDDLSKEVLNEKYNNNKIPRLFFAISISKWSSNKKNIMARNFNTLFEVNTSLSRRTYIIMFASGWQQMAMLMLNLELELLVI